MHFKITSWAFIFLATIVMGYLIWSTIKRIKEDNLSYGKDFNNVRDSLGVPIIEDNWIISESNEYYRFWTNPDTTIWIFLRIGNLVLKLIVK
jgi:hypothetical protein